MTLLVRDEADIVDAQLAFHLAAGVDFVIATDHRSQDGTRDILRRYERAGCLKLIARGDERYRPGEWVNHMARLAVEHGADWVFHADADEFWWPRGGDLKEILGAIPARFGAVFCLWRHFAPRPDDGRFFAERMTVRLSARNPWRTADDPFHPQVKVAHRADRSVRLREGTHDLEGRLPVLRGWYPIEVLHFPLRTPAQAEGKFAAWRSVLQRPDDVGRHVAAAVAALDEGRFADLYERYVVDDSTLAEGIAATTLAVDTRVRDALRRLLGDRDRPLPARPTFPLPRDAARLTFPPLALAEEAALAADASALPESIARLRARVERLESRLAALERGSPRRLFRRLLTPRRR
jgi:hypothetical protein